MTQKKPKREQPKALVEKVPTIEAQIEAALKGQPASLQGNAIAMALGRFLSGHRVLSPRGDLLIDETRKMRSVVMIGLTKAAFGYCATYEDQSSKEAEDGHRPIKGSNRKRP